MPVFFIADAGAVCQCWESAEATMDGFGKENPVNSMFRDFSGNSAEHGRFSNSTLLNALPQLFSSSEYEFFLT